MYKNIFYDYKTNLVHLNTDNGYLQFEYDRYAYIKSDTPTKYKSIFGDYVKKVHCGRKEDPHTFLEIDVKPEHRVLIDMFGHNNDVSKNVNIWGLDIEVEMTDSGFVTPQQSTSPVLAITMIEFSTKKIKTFLLDSSKRYKDSYQYGYDVVLCRDEWELFRNFIIYWNEQQIDLITGWNVDFYDFPYIYNRMEKLFHNGLVNKLSPYDTVTYNLENNKVKIAGISVLDYIKLYKKYTPQQRPSYKLDEIAKIELGKEKVKYNGSLQTLFNSDIDLYVHYNVIDVMLILDLEEKLKFINKARMLAHIAHIPYEDVISAVATTEGLFLSQTNALNLVVPNKPTTISEWDKRLSIGNDDLVNEDEEKFDSDKIVGAYVKPPRKGRFSYTYDEDLTSLYPMIDVTLNISPETKYAIIDNYITVWTEHDKTHFKINHEIFNDTLEVPDFDTEINIKVRVYNENKFYKIPTMGALYTFMNERNLTLSGNGVFYKKDNQGVIPMIIMEIFNKRKEFKKLRDVYLEQNNHELEEYYDNQQWTMKIVINSIYGVLCNEFFRFYDKDNAQSITLTGRYANLSAMDTVYHLHQDLYNKLDHIIEDSRLKELFNDPILAGDTDSIIMTAEPILYVMYGKDWMKQDKHLLLNTVLKISKKLSNKINERMDTFATYWLNSDNNKLFFKEEWVALAGFYTGVKKRYANKIALKEGVILQEPKMDIKGLDIVRSDFPKVCQDFMKDLLSDILDYNDEGIDKKVTDFYATMESYAVSDYTKIARISSVKTYDKYVGANFDFISGTPASVKASANYNKYLKYEDILSKYKPIQGGDKIGWVYLEKNLYGFDNMAIPLNEYIDDKIHDFVIENIDYKKTISSLLDNKIELYYNALDWRVPFNGETLEQLLGL